MQQLSKNTMTEHSALQEFSMPGKKRPQVSLYCAACPISHTTGILARNERVGNESVAGSSHGASPWVALLQIKRLRLQCVGFGHIGDDESSLGGRVPRFLVLRYSGISTHHLPTGYVR